MDKKYIYKLVFGFMYTKPLCGIHVFDEMHITYVAAWIALVIGYVY